MKKLKYIGGMMLAALLGLSSCGSDNLAVATGNGQGKGHKVSLAIGSGTAKTRATAEPTDLGGFAREKAIDGTKLYAVVFDTQGKFSKTYQIDDYDATDGSCSFTLDEAGAYYGYIVANTSKGTELTGLTAGMSTEADFYNIVEDTDPGTALDASTNFLMLSKRTLFDVNGDADTDLGTISLTRAVARIDIDVTAIDGLAITEVEIENRYTKSLLVRGSSPATLTSATDTKTYKRGTGTGEINAKNDATGIITDQQWQGVIYGYENIDANTVVKITHTLNGVASTTTVNFADVNSGQAVKRNNIYTVKLIDGAEDPTLNDIQASILVIDWDNSTNILYGKDQLTDHEKPDFNVTSTHGVLNSEDAATKLNPGKVIARKTDTSTEITLKVTSKGKVASGVSFVDKNGNPYDFAGEGGDITETSSSFVDGKIVQEFTITVPQTLVNNMAVSDFFTFKVHNVFDDTAVASREFNVAIRDVKMNPLWYVAEFNALNSTSMGTTLSDGYYFTWAHAMQYFGAQSTSYDGYRVANKTLSNTETGTTWHLPTLMEFQSIVPVNSMANSGTITSIIGDKMDSGSGTYRSSTVSSVWGYDDETKSGAVIDASYWKQIEKYGEIHAIRFLGTKYCSAWKYKVDKANKKVIISSILIDEIDNSEDEAKLFYENKWSTLVWGNNYANGAVERELYMGGHRGLLSSTSSEKGEGATCTNQIGERVLYWLATQESGQTSAVSFDIAVWNNAASQSTNKIGFVYHGDNTYPFQVRLFRDN